MAFKVYKKDKITFEVDGETIILHIDRLSAKKEMLFNLKVARLQEGIQNNDAEALAEVYTTYADLLAEMTYEIEGIERSDLPNGKWSQNKEERIEIFEACGIEFLNAAIGAYNESKKKTIDPKN